MSTSRSISVRPCGGATVVPEQFAVGQRQREDLAVVEAGDDHVAVNDRRPRCRAASGAAPVARRTRPRAVGDAQAPRRPSTVRTTTSSAIIGGASTSPPVATRQRSAPVAASSAIRSPSLSPARRGRSPTAGPADNDTWSSRPVAMPDARPSRSTSPRAMPRTPRLRQSSDAARAADARSPPPRSTTISSRRASRRGREFGRRIDVLVLVAAERDVSEQRARRRRCTRRADRADDSSWSASTGSLCRCRGRRAPPTSCSLSSMIGRRSALGLPRPAPPHIRRVRPPIALGKQRVTADLTGLRREPAGLLEIQQLQRLVMLALLDSTRASRSCAMCASSSSSRCRRRCAAKRCASSNLP